MRLFESDNGGTEGISGAVAITDTVGRADAARQ